MEGIDGRWLAIEAKLSPDMADVAAANLLRVCAKIERPPTAMIVMPATGVAHRRPDGVLVVPLSVLG